VVPSEICPANVNQHVCIIRCVDALSPEFLSFYLSNPDFQKFIFDTQAGATRQALTKHLIENFLIPLPPLDEQRRIAGRLKEQLAAVESARKAAEEQLRAARLLSSAYLHELFGDSASHNWSWGKLGDVCELLPAKTIKSIGDTVVTAITTACLSENGFLPAGLKSARMDAKDARQALVTEGEILIARSNTPGLVGRVSMYAGDPPNVVASDLTIRIWASPFCHPPFLTAYLSYLYLKGFWKEVAGGASGSMKKITRTQVLDVRIPVPSIETQKKIVAQMRRKMDRYRQLEQSLESQLAEINRLPASLLREAFHSQ
jgi:type I restriction enzyme S subunit